MKKTKLINRFKLLSSLTASLLIALASLFVLSSHASAGSLTNSYIKLNRMKAGTDSTMRVVFKTNGNAGATGLTINMNGSDSSTWTGNSGTVNATQAISGTAGCDVSATALPGSPTASGSGSTITVSSVTALSANTTYCFDLTTSSSVHTPSAGEYHPVITETGGATDSETVAVRVISNDQIVVSATVPPTFNFQLASGCSSNQDNFTANLATSGTNTTGGCTWQVDTNSTTGWYCWASDSSTGLQSANASHTIASTTPGTNATIANGTEGYVLGVTSITQGSGSGGTTSATNAYGNGAGGVATSYKGSGLDGTARLIASSTGTASGAQFITKEFATISSVTQAATDYTDTITFIAAGSF